MCKYSHIEHPGIFIPIMYDVFAIDLLVNRKSYNPFINLDNNLAKVIEIRWMTNLTC